MPPYTHHVRILMRVRQKGKDHASSTGTYKYLQVVYVNRLACALPCLALSCPGRWIQCPTRIAVVYGVLSPLCRFLAYGALPSASSVRGVINVTSLWDGSQIPLGNPPHGLLFGIHRYHPAAQTRYSLHSSPE